MHEATPMTEASVRELLTSAGARATSRSGRSQNLREGLPPGG